MAVFTVYNHGTGGTRTKPLSKGEIVNIFGNEHAQLDKDPNNPKEFIEFMITEGVGSSGKPHEHEIRIGAKGVPEYGRIPPNMKEVAFQAVFPPAAILGSLKWIRDNVSVIQQALGTGVDQNVKNIVTVVEWLAAQGKAPTAINMMGWSRGAVTCIRAAHYLNQSKNAAVKAIPVNIFAVDPVAGAGHNNEADAKTIGPNVKHYVATLSLDELRKGFSPMDDKRLTLSPTTKSMILPLHGIHSDTAKWSQVAGYITFDMCYRFLKKFGSPLPVSLGMFQKSASATALNYTSQLVEDQKTLHASMKVVNKGQGFWGGLAGGGRTPRTVDVKKYAVNGDYFLNFHHEATFEKAYPKSYEAFFGKERPNRGSPAWKTKFDKDIAAELKNLPPDQKSALDTLAKTPGPALAQTEDKALSDSKVFLKECGLLD